MLQFYRIAFSGLNLPEFSARQSISSGRTEKQAPTRSPSELFKRMFLIPCVKDTSKLRVLSEVQEKEKRRIYHVLSGA